MARVLYRIGRWSFRRKWWVISTWLVLLALMAVLSVALYRPFTSQFSISGTPSIRATEMLAEEFPDMENPVTATSVTMVFEAPEGSTLTDPEVRATVDRTIAELEEGLGEELSDTSRFGNPVDVNEALSGQIHEMYSEFGLPDDLADEDAVTVATLSEDERIGYTTFSVDSGDSMVVTGDQREIISNAMQEARDAGLTVEAGGQGFGAEIEIEPMSEVIGLVVAFAVLLFTMGSLVASGLPLLTAVLGVAIGTLAIVITNSFSELNNVTPTLAIMIGLAVGIDYSLFVLSRYRAERQARPNDEATGHAVGTAGSAVVFAGVTVIVALAALSVAGIGFLTAMGLLAALTVLVAVLVTLTFTPALLGVLGDRIFRARIPGVAGNPTRSGTRRPRHTTLGRRWVRLIHRVPGLAIAVVIVALGLLTVPVTRLQLTLPTDSTSDHGTTQRESADLLAEGFGDGVNAQLLVVVDGSTADPDSAALAPYMSAQRAAAEEAGTDFDAQQAATLSTFLYTVDQLDGMADVRNAQLAGLNEDATAAEVVVTPWTGPADEATMTLSDVLRDRTAEIEDATGATLGTTGMTAVQLDITEELSAAMPVYLGIVVGLAIVLLMVVFRSLLVPVAAGLGFLLSVGAAFGLTVLVWQEGLWGLVNTPGPLVSFMPIFLIGVTFGLAMDYQVFLVTRMREHWTTTGGQASGRTPYNANEEAIIHGFARGARVVTAAAIIMVAVFIAFVAQPLPFVKIFGFALAAGVFFDAFFIRMTFIPAVMFLFGRANWWFPRWLDRIVPHFDVEGSQLDHAESKEG